MKEKILVTGGAGFIGSHVCDSLLDNDYKIICVDNFDDYYPKERKRKNIQHNLGNKDFFLEDVDITNYKKLEKIFIKYKPEKIIHLAAKAGVRNSIKNPFIYEKVNVAGTINLLELAKEFKIKNFIFGSSSSVYGNNEKIPFSEEDNTDKVLSVYAATKKAAELLCHSYSYLYDLNITCLRFFTVYGPRGRPDMAPYLFTRLIDKGKEITVFGNGTSKRDYTYVADIVQAIILALNKNFRFEIINLGNSEMVELKTLIKIIENLLGKKAKIKYKEMPKEDVKITYADISKAKKLLGWEPKTNIREGMRNFIEWYKKN